MTRLLGMKATSTEGIPQSEELLSSTTRHQPSYPAHCSLILRLIGIALLVVGLGCAVLGPAELYCFYFFVQGGRFHYPGFQFGSFMFAFLVIQIIGYYAIAAACIPLGYAHLRLRRWARSIALAGLGFWLVVGIPMATLFVAVLVTSKEPSLAVVVASLGMMVVLYPILPFVLIRFYRSPAVQSVLEQSDPQPGWSDQVPVPIWSLCMLFAFWIVALHTAILLSGTFPAFGVLLMGLPGILCIEASILLLAALTWATMQRWSWAWWGNLVYFGLATLSTIWTFAGSSWLEILDRLEFAPLEVQALSGVPASGMHIAAFVGLPLIGTLATIVRARPCFSPGRSVNAHRHSTLH
jgi:hypothetical protein